MSWVDPENQNRPRRGPQVEREHARNAVERWRVMSWLTPRVGDRRMGAREDPVKNKRRPSP